MDEESEAANELTDSVRRLKAWTELEKGRMLGAEPSVRDPAAEAGGQQMQGDGLGGGFS